MLAVVGAFQQLSYDMKHGLAEFDLPMIVYYSPWYIFYLWIVNLIFFLRDMFSRNNSEKHGMGRVLFGIVMGAVITTIAAVQLVGGEKSQPPHILEAAKRGKIKVVKRLLAAGADVNAKVVSGAKQGETPLDAANVTNHPEIADLLRKHGGKISEVIQESLLIFDRNSNILSAAN